MRANTAISSVTGLRRARPDFYFIDDPQTDDGATNSEAVTSAINALISDLHRRDTNTIMLITKGANNENRQNRN